MTPPTSKLEQHLAAHAGDDDDEDDDPGAGILYPRSSSIGTGPSSRSSSPYPPHEQSQRRLSALSTTNSNDTCGSSYSVTSDPTNIYQLIQHQREDQNERESGDESLSQMPSAGSDADVYVDELKPAKRTSVPSAYRVEEHLIPKDVAIKLCNHMEKRVAEVLEHSRYLQRHCGFDVPRFSHTDVQMGDMIARGGFAVIMEIQYFTTGCELNEDENEDKEYVLKYLNPKLVANLCKDPDPNNEHDNKVYSGAKDLVLEAHILSALHHPNIIALRGLSTHGIHGYKLTGGRADGFFLVLDRLTGTLSKKVFHEWKPLAEKNPTVLRLDALTTNTLTMDFFVDRIRTALDIASALVYLHDHQILHRDIKPANIGFDVTDTLKVFDFGLAVEVPFSDKPNQLYDLSGNTGTPRFMAPEVMKRKPYNFKADVYSFTVLLWELMTLEKPYQGMDGDAVRDYVAIRCERPPMCDYWPESITKIFKRGWSKRIEHRPTMAEMHHCLSHLLSAPLQPAPLPAKHSSMMLPGAKLFRARRSLDMNKNTALA